MRSVISGTPEGHKGLSAWLWTNLDISPLIVFRVLYGIMLAAEAFGAILTGWVKETFIDPPFTFTFIGFEWLQPLPGYGMYFYYFVMGLAGVGVILGWRYRLSMLVYNVMWLAVYLMQKSNYNNHYYLLVLLNALMLIMPAHRKFSLDVRAGRAEEADYCPRWCMLVFILQLFIVYTYASIAKLYPDWIEGRMIRLWFSAKRDYAIIGELLQEPWLQKMVVWGGILFDGLIIPLLLIRRTRTFAVILGFFFHLFNSAVFNIGVFPFLMLTMLVFFYPPEQVRRFFFENKWVQLAHKPLENPVARPRWLITYTLILFIAIQVWLPLRHLTYPSYVHWSEEGHRLAWHMMLRSKYGNIQFQAVDTATGKMWWINPYDSMAPHQANAMASRPDMIWQYAQRLRRHFEAEGVHSVKIHAHSHASLNDHPLQPFVDPKVDLARVEWYALRSSDWILPMREE